MSIIRTFLSLLFFFAAFSTQAQTINWRSYVDKTFVFEISGQEAETLLRSKQKDSLILKMTRNAPPLSSFSTKRDQPKSKQGYVISSDLKEWKDQPKQGHFIFADIYENKVSYQYFNIIPFQVFLFKEYDALTLQVIDEKGKIRNDAKVTIKKPEKLFNGNRPVKFDEKSRTYTVKEKSKKQKHILSVQLDGFEAFFDLTKYHPNNFYRNYDSYNELPQFYSYLITDKNKYKPNETVRFKSYALSGNREPLTDTLEVLVDSRKIVTLAPYNPGGYAGEFNLHDSLKLRLDRSYSLKLRDNEGRIVGNASFRYEDYELNDTRLHVKLQNSVHYFPDTNRIEIRATDANGLLLQDVKADILIKRKNVQKSYSELLVLPDTLMYKQIELDNTASTPVDIPCTLFGESDCSYEIHVRIVNFDQRVLTYYSYVNFYRSYYDIVCETKQNVLYFDFYKLGNGESVKATIRYNNSKETKEILLPHREFFDPAVYEYDIDIPELDFHKKIKVSELNSGLNLTGGIVSDSLKVQLVNPLQLDVSWYLYQGGNLLEKGFGKNIEIKQSRVSEDYTYYVDLFYTMGNREKSFRRTFSVKESYLSVDMNLPDRIYPGQQVDVTVKVENAKKKPGKNVDLTAFSVNSQLGYSIPDLPYYGKRPLYRKKRPDYSLSQKDAYVLQVPLDYAFWNQYAGLDTMDYYRFAYPRNRMFEYKINTPDSTAQFAPYVMKGGNAVNIYVIEANGKPIYFSWTEQPEYYSFPVSDTLAYKITLRLHDRIILLDSIRFEAGRKTIFSLDLDYLPANARQIMIDEKDHRGSHIFTENEKNVYGNLISRIEVKNRDFTYLKQGEVIYPVYSSRFPVKAYYGNTRNILTGPVPNGKTDYNGEITYNHKNGYSYEYEDNVVYKSPYAVCPGSLDFSSSNNFNRLNNFHFSQEQIKKLMEEHAVKAIEESWHPRHIGISMLNGINLSFRLPEEKDSSCQPDVQRQGNERADFCRHIPKREIILSSNSTCLLRCNIAL